MQHEEHEDGWRSEDEEQDEDDDDSDAAWWPKARRRDASADGRGGESGDDDYDDDSEHGEGDDQGDDGGCQGMSRIPGGSCFRRFVYAVRSQDGRVPRKPTHSGTARGKRKKQTEPTAAAARQGQAFYGIFPIEAILNRAPLQKPFDWDAEKDGAWDPERKPLKTRGWFEYDDDIAFDLYAWK